MKNVVATMVVLALVSIGNKLQAQNAAIPMRPVIIHAPTPTSDMSTLLQQLETVVPMSASQLPEETHGFYSAQNPDWPPLPGDVLGLPIWPIGSGLFVLDDVNIDYNAIRVENEAALSVQRLIKGSAGGGFHAMDVPSVPGDGDGGSGGSFSPMFSLSNDYGTNLWIAQVAVSSNNFVGIASNTLADVEYEIQSRTNLLQTNWQSEGFILGSELTNWTPLSVAQNGRPILFLQLRSWVDSGGSGLPDWWQLQYFGTNGVDPYADPDGDGWNNLQEFQNGTDPTVFNTPPAPQGLTATLNQPANTAAIRWLSSPGAVASYTLEKTDPKNYPTTVQDFSLSASSNSYSDNLSGDSHDPFNGNDYDVSYRIKAVYTNGYSSAWSASLPLQQPTVSAVITAGTNGATYLAVWGVPANAATVRLVFIDESAVDFHHDTSFDYSEDISVSSFTNGIYQLPTAWQPPGTDAYGNANYGVYAESVDTNDDASGPTLIDEDWNLSFYDGRIQLKQNLIFLLRAATVDYPFGFAPLNAYGSEGARIAYSANCASASFYQIGAFQGAVRDVLEPFEDNYLFRNFVFNSADVNTNGQITTGAGSDYSYGANNDLTLRLSPTYSFAGVVTNTTLLATNQTRWLYSSGIVSSETAIWYDGSFYEMVSNVYNLFGLPFLSTEAAYGNGGTLGTSTFYPGDTFTNGVHFYSETAQPRFQTAEYDFWNLVTDWLPGSGGFSTTNTSRLWIASVGNEIFIAGYAKLAVTNSLYSGVYGYLGQYFDKAYQITNGVVTTNTTGVLSPYGDFLATQPGPAALVTMPDVDTGARGTCTVYAVSLVLDKNHDGTMDLSFNGQDATSQSSPYVFWANQNFDRWATNEALDGLLYTEFEQDDQQIAFCPAYPDTVTPDYNYSNVLANGYAYRAIPCTRDLEDFTRLWVAGVTSNLLAALPAGSTITLSWGDVGSPNSANPTIDLFAAADTDGGIGYQTNETVATEQTNVISCPYIGRLGPGQSIQLNSSYFSGWAGNHFIWCGVNNGSGGLSLTIADASNNILAQTTAYIQIMDIKQMYERWTVGDPPGVAPLTNAILATEGLPVGESVFKYTLPQDTNTPYILLTHGYNMKPWEKDAYAETAYKRLYWQGYQGRFGMFGWPTAQNAVQFGASELQAWASAQGLLNKLNDLNAEYPGHVYLAAHSLGNVVASEALALAGSTQVVNTYVAMQAAVAAHAYDATTAVFNLGAFYNGAPDCYAHYSTAGSPSYFNATAGAGTYVNFFNVNDWALTNAWLTFQEAKPVLSPSYSYTAGTGAYYKNFGITELFFPGDRYELFANFIQAPCYALGMQPNVGGAFKTLTYNQVELDNPPYSFGTQHIYHSGEFRSDNPQRWQFWSEVLVRMGLK